MKAYLKIASLFLMAASLLVSCEKDNTEDLPEEEHVHTLEHVEARRHTATENGCYEHWKCTECGKTFADSAGETEKPLIIDWADDVMICPEDALAAFDGNGEKFDEFSNSMDFPISNSSPASVIITQIAVKSLSAIMDKVFEYTHNKEEDPSGQIIYVINEKYMEVMNKLGDIQKSIDALAANIKIQTFKNAMERRYEEQTALYNATDATFRQIIRICGNKRYSELSDEDRESVEELLDIWYHAPVNGNNVITEVMNMLDGALMTFDTGTCYPEIYDQVAYQSYPFEHLGYDMRESARYVDALTISESYMMSCMWFQLHGGDKLFNEHLLSLNAKLTSYAEVLDSHQVKKQTDYTVSQVKGFREGCKLTFAFKSCKDPYDFFDGCKDSYDWRLFVDDGYKKSDCSMKFSHLKYDLYEYMAGDDKLATTEEYRALWEFYGGKKSVSRIFEEAGFTGCTYSILSTHSGSAYSWHHIESDGLLLEQTAARLNFSIDVAVDALGESKARLFRDSCGWNTKNGHLELGPKSSNTYSYPEWLGLW